VYSMVYRGEKEQDSRYIQEASAPAAVTVYQTCNIMYICNTGRPGFSPEKPALRAAGQA